MTAPSFKPNRFADRGAKAEAAVQKFLTEWAAADPRREFERLVDTKAAGRVIKAAAADFAVYAVTDSLLCLHGLIEVKETMHEFRLDRSRITQMPRLRKRAKAGGQIYVLIHHSTLKQWRCLTMNDLGDPSDTKGSWDLRGWPAYPTPGEALARAGLTMWGGHAK